MALDIDTHYALRTPAELRALVEAVRRAAPTDEPEAVEWKGQVDDVASKKWMVEVAKQIIGMANRDPATAQLTFEGCGYLLLGVEPGAVPGVRALDHADVENKTAPYLGGQGLRWTWINLTVGRQTVAVVTVEAPRWGDPIFCFQSGYSPINPGAIFLRL